MRTQAFNRALGIMAVGMAIALVASRSFTRRQRNRHQDDDDQRVDHELDDSFPASDPPSHSSPLGAQAG